MLLCLNIEFLFLVLRNVNYFTEIGSEIATVSCQISISEGSCGRRNLHHPNAEAGSSDSERQMPVLKNGSIYDLEPIKINDCIVEVKNTCPFDSVFHLVLSCYLDRKHPRVRINKLSNHIPFFKLIQEVAKYDATYSSYVQRAIILLPLFGNDVNNNESVILDCAGYADTTCVDVIREAYSLKQVKKCNKCQKARDYNQHILSVPAEYLRSEEMAQQFSEVVKCQDLKCTQNKCRGTEKSTIVEAGKILVYFLKNPNFHRDL